MHSEQLLSAVKETVESYEAGFREDALWESIEKLVDSFHQAAPLAAEGSQSGSSALPAAAPRAGRESPCTDERMCTPCFTGIGQCENPAPIAPSGDAGAAPWWTLVDPQGRPRAAERSQVKAWARLAGYKLTVENLLAYEQHGWCVTQGFRQAAFVLQAQGATTMNAEGTAVSSEPDEQDPSRAAREGALPDDKATIAELRAALVDVVGWMPGRAAWNTDAPIKSVERAHKVIAATGALK